MTFFLIPLNLTKPNLNLNLTYPILSYITVQYIPSLHPSSQLGQVVRRDVGTIPLELVQLETAGLVLRWSPLEGPDTHHITLADVDHLIDSLHHQLVSIGS